MSAHGTRQCKKSGDMILVLAGLNNGVIQGGNKQSERANRELGRALALLYPWQHPTVETHWLGRGVTRCVMASPVGSYWVMAWHSGSSTNKCHVETKPSCDMKLRCSELTEVLEHQPFQAESSEYVLHSSRKYPAYEEWPPGCAAVTWAAEWYMRSPCLRSYACLLCWHCWLVAFEMTFTYFPHVLTVTKITLFSNFYNKLISALLVKWFLHLIICCCPVQTGCYRCCNDSAVRKIVRIRYDLICDVIHTW